MMLAPFSIFTLAIIVLVIQELISYDQVYIIYSLPSSSIHLFIVVKCLSLNCLIGKFVCGLFVMIMFNQHMQQQVAKAGK